MSPESVVRRLYDLVTFEPGTTPDLTEVRELFLPEAVIVLRTSKDGSSVFDVEGFVADFVAFIEQSDAVTTGFSETIIALEPMVFRDIAHVLVSYEVYLPKPGRSPRMGVDSFGLVKRDGRWLIGSVLNDVPNADHPLPSVLLP
jgi:hypothetical protein